MLYVDKIYLPWDKNRKKGQLIAPKKPFFTSYVFHKTLRELSGELYPLAHCRKKLHIHSENYSLKQGSALILLNLPSFNPDYF